MALLQKYCKLKSFKKKHIYNESFHYMISNPKQPSCKKVCGPEKGYGEKRCEIQGGGQEMAVMVG